MMQRSGVRHWRLLTLLRVFLKNAKAVTQRWFLMRNSCFCPENTYLCEATDTFNPGIMLSKKIFEVLQNLEKNQHKKLRWFLLSPYYNRGAQSEAILRLYDECIAYKLDENHPMLQKSEVFARFYPGQPFRENEKSPLDALSSDLFKLIRKFIAISMVEDENWDVREDWAMTSFYRRNGLDDRFKQSIQSFRKTIENLELRDHSYFAAQYQVENELVQFQGLNHTSEDDANLLKVNQCLDIEYLIRKLDFVCALEFQAKFTDLSPQNSKITHFVQNEITTDDYPDVPVIGLYLATLQIIRNPGEEALFDTFEGIYEKVHQQLTLERQISISTYYRFFWTRKYLKSGTLEIVNKLFNIYKNHYEKGYFYIDGKITAPALRNLLNFSLKNHHSAWAKEVLDAHTPEQITGTKFPVEMHSLNYAEYYFYQKEFDRALEHLVYRNFENPTYSILADVLMIKVFYETQNELLEYRVNAMRQKVVRAAFTAEVKSRYHNFVNKMEKLIKYGWEKGNPKIARLLEETQTIPNIIEREWLLEKMQALLDKTKK
jgi:hypothetical protein